MKAFIILRGLPGCGKSTFAGEFLGHAEIYSTDNFFKDINGDYQFDKTRLSEAHKWTREACFEALEAGVETVVLDNTNVEEWEFLPYLKKAGECGYTTFSLVVENRHGRASTHGNFSEEYYARKSSAFALRLKP